MKEKLYDRASSLAVKCAAELHSIVIDGRFYHVTEQFDAVQSLIYRELEKDAELIQALEAEIGRLTAASPDKKHRENSAYQLNGKRGKSPVNGSIAAQ